MGDVFQHPTLGRQVTVPKCNYLEIFNEYLYIRQYYEIWGHGSKYSYWEGLSVEVLFKFKSEIWKLMVHRNTEEKEITDKVNHIYKSSELGYLEIKKKKKKRVW